MILTVNTITQNLHTQQGPNKNDFHTTQEKKETMFFDDGH